MAQATKAAIRRTCGWRAPAPPDDTMAPIYLQEDRLGDADFRKPVRGELDFRRLAFDRKALEAFARSVWPVASESADDTDFWAAAFRLWRPDPAAAGRAEIYSYCSSTDKTPRWRSSRFRGLRGECTDRSARPCPDWAASLAGSCRSAAARKSGGGRLPRR